MSANGAVSGNCGFNTPNCEVIDQADYDVWRANFGRKVSTSGLGSGAIGSSAVPEPAGAALALLAAAASGWIRRRNA
jgi:MYXO-CTERM domain-containing protein